MGILTKHKKSNRDTISKEVREYEGYTVKFYLKEYDLYERILWMRDEYRRQSLVVTVYPHEMNDGIFDPFIKQTYAWRKERGPSKSLEFQVECAWTKVKAEIKERLGFEEDLGNAVDGLGLEVGDSRSESRPEGNSASEVNDDE